MPRISEKAVKSTPRKIAAHAIIFIIVIVEMSAVSIWLGCGPVALSRGVVTLIDSSTQGPNETKTRK